MTYIFNAEKPLLTNIISPLRPSIWANLLNEVEEALIQTRLNPWEQVADACTYACVWEGEREEGQKKERWNCMVCETSRSSSWSWKCVTEDNICLYLWPCCLHTWKQSISGSAMYKFCTFPGAQCSHWSGDWTSGCSVHKRAAQAVWWGLQWLSYPWRGFFSNRKFQSEHFPIYLKVWMKNP